MTCRELAARIEELQPEAMPRDVVTVSPSLAVSKAARILLENKYGCLPVVDDEQRLQGIVTEADFLRLTVQLLP